MDEGVWADVDIHSSSSSEEREAVDDAHLEALPALLKAALARARSKNGLDEYARVFSVKIERPRGRLEFAIRCGSIKEATLVYDATGTWLEDRP